LGFNKSISIRAHSKIREGGKAAQSIWEVSGRKEKQQNRRKGLPCLELLAETRRINSKRDGGRKK